MIGDNKETFDSWIRFCQITYYFNVEDIFIISDIDKANQKAQYSKRNCSATTPRTNNALVYLFISGQEKCELWIFFKKLTSNSVKFHIAIAIYHAWVAVYIIVFV